VKAWFVYRGTGEPHDGIARLPAPPPWRTFTGGPPLPRIIEEPLDGHRAARARTYLSDNSTVELVNAAVYLRRPLLVTGLPGTGKSSLAHAVAAELQLGPVLYWPVSSRSTLGDGLYRYDALGRVEDSSVTGGRRKTSSGTADIGRYLRLGPLGTALLPYDVPRVLLIDEIDKSDVDLPNDLLNVMEEGEFEIPELSRIAYSTPRVEVQTHDPARTAEIADGLVRCRQFPITIMTSNGERDFPAAFLRRCVRLDLAQPDGTRLAHIVRSHLGPDAADQADDLVSRFLARRERGELATDQLLNAVYLTQHAARERGGDREHLADIVLRHLSDST